MSDPLLTPEPDAEITVEHMDAWVRVYSKQNVFHADFAVKLSQSLDRWRNRNPQLQIHAVVPIMSGGRTVELHAWYHPNSVDRAILVKPAGG